MPELNKHNTDSEYRERIINTSAGIFKALSNPLRLRILMMLRNEELSVHDIQERLDISQPLASQHLKVLRNQGLLKERREGKYVYYRLKSRDVTKLMAGALQIQTVELAAESELMVSLSEMMSFWAF